MAPFLNGFCQDEFAASVPPPGSTKECWEILTNITQGKVGGDIELSKQMAPSSRMRRSAVLGQTAPNSGAQHPPLFRDEYAELSIRNTAVPQSVQRCSSACEYCPIEMDIPAYMP